MSYPLQSNASKGGDPVSLAVITHEACLEHVTPEGHPERVARLEAIMNVLSKPVFDELATLEAPRVTREQMELAHTPAYLDQLERAYPDEGFVALDGDTSLSPGSREAVLRAAGAAVMAVDEVMAGSFNRVFCATRPPGHHAEPDVAMGFCFLANAVIAARHAQDAHGLERVCIADFDVHHGNGTQACVADDASILYVSSHESPLFPGSGSRHETGVGNIVNLPMPAGTTGPELQDAWRDEALPRMVDFNPELLIISAGFDAHIRDPLANMQLHDHDFGDLTSDLVAFANTHCNGRIVSLLEGGYDLQGLSRGVAAHLAALSERDVAGVLAALD